MLSRRKRLFLYRGRKALWQTWEVTEFNWVENKRLVMRFCTRLAGLCWQAASTASLLTIHWAELTENRNWRTTVCLLPSPEWWKCWPGRIKTKLQLWNAATCLFLSVVTMAVTFLLQQVELLQQPWQEHKEVCSPALLWQWAIFLLVLAAQERPAAPARQKLLLEYSSICCFEKSEEQWLFHLAADLHNPGC